jgi:hypothetical protein
MLVASTAIPTASSSRTRRHRGLARPLVAVRRRAVLMVTKGQRPHPGRAYWRRVHLRDPADERTIIGICFRLCRRLQCALRVVQPPNSASSP